jgi:hypothetical protein
LKAVIDACMEPDTTVISDCWEAYRYLDAEGYTYRAVHHSTGFVDQRSGAHTNTVESTRRHVKAFLSLYNMKGDYIYHLAHYMFAVRCRAEKLYQYVKFLRLAAIDCSIFLPAPSESCAT